MRQIAALAAEIIGFPRHLSQHVGGFVITRSRLDEVMPIGNGAMPDRTFVEWDKDDLDALGILKIDVLGLGMLSCIRKAFDLVERHYAEASCPGRSAARSDALQTRDPAIHKDQLGPGSAVHRSASLHAAPHPGHETGKRFDTLHHPRRRACRLPHALPRRLARRVPGGKPRADDHAAAAQAANFYDLVIEVAIVRPGPIQGDMVHPYLRRRSGEEPVSYPSKELEAVLDKTLGVPLFQEQAMKIAIVAAGFTPAEADKLRRAMATFKRVGTIGTFQRKMIDGMLANGYERSFAERCFHQIEGFGEYGFPESHAASFALLVYASAWLKCRYPDAFAAALLNAQPMGFYAPAQIVRDAREHGVEVRAPDINHSQWDSTFEPGPRAAERLHALHAEMREDVRATHAIRLGLREIKGFAEEDARLIVAQRGSATTPCATSGCARAFRRACWNGWPTPMPSPRSASPAARRCGRRRRSAASAIATTICRCLRLLLPAFLSLYLPLKGGGRPPKLQAKAGGWGSMVTLEATPTPTLPLSGGGRSRSAR